MHILALARRFAGPVAGINRTPCGYAQTRRRKREIASRSTPAPHGCAPGPAGRNSRAGNCPAAVPPRCCHPAPRRRGIFRAHRRRKTRARCAASPPSRAWISRLYSCSNCGSSCTSSTFNTARLRPGHHPRRAAVLTMAWRTPNALYWSSMFADDRLVIGDGHIRHLDNTASSSGPTPSSRRCTLKPPLAPQLPRDVQQQKLRAMGLRVMPHQQYARRADSPRRARKSPARWH